MGKLQEIYLMHLRVNEWTGGFNLAYQHEENEEDKTPGVLCKNMILLIAIEHISFNILKTSSSSRKHFFLDNFTAGCYCLHPPGHKK